MISEVFWKRDEISVVKQYGEMLELLEETRSSLSLHLNFMKLNVFYDKFDYSERTVTSIPACRLSVLEVFVNAKIK